MRNNSGCLTGAVAAFSRLFLLFAWIARPVAWDTAFGSFIVPCLGFLFLPFTTLMYYLLSAGTGMVTGLDWLWLLLAAALDIAGLGAAGAANRDRLPAGVPGSTAGSTAPPAAPPPPPPAAQ